MLCYVAGKHISSLSRLWAVRRSSTLPHLPVFLRPYQQQSLDACLDALEAGHSRLGVSLPTGSGKTTVFVYLLSRISPPPTNENATRSLIIVNSIELARQAAVQVARLFPQWTVEIEQGGKHVASGFADVTVATYQTLNKEQRILKFDPWSMKAVVIDEAHHAAAKSYRALLSRFHPDIKHPDPEVIQDVPPPKIPIIGFSATFGRHDGLNLGTVFERIVYHRDFLEMIKEQWLCDVRFTSVRVKLDLQNVTINGRNGDFNTKSLAAVVNTPVVNELVVKTWIDRASNRKSTLVFCVNIDHVKTLTQTFRKYGIDARYIFAETPHVQRRTLVDGFRAGEFPVLVNCAILTEGADIPNIDCVLVARPTRSRNVFAQMIGRGMRLSPQTGKEDCRIIDFVDNNDLVTGVISAPTLFGLDPKLFECDDESPKSLEKRAEEAEKSKIFPSSASVDPTSIPDPTSVIYTDHDDIFTMIDTAEPLTNIHGMSSLAWVACGDGIYVLELLKMGYIRIGPDESEPGYTARYTPSSFAKPSEEGSSSSPYLRSRKLLSAESLRDVVRGADKYAVNHIFRNVPTSGLYRKAKWRLSPATDAQKEVIRKRWSRSSSKMTDEEKEEFFAKLTKGGAASIITRLKHGSHGRLVKRAKEMNKVIDVLAKEDMQKTRQTVKVGLLTA